MKKQVGELFGMPVVTDDELGPDELRLKQIPAGEPYLGPDGMPDVELLANSVRRTRILTREQFEAEFGRPAPKSG